MRVKSYCGICLSKTSYLIQRRHIACSLASVRVTTSVCQPVKGSRLEVIVPRHAHCDISSITTYRVAAALNPSCVAQPHEAYERHRLLLGFAVSHARSATDCRALPPGLCILQFPSRCVESCFGGEWRFSDHCATGLGWVEAQAMFLDILLA